MPAEEGVRLDNEKRLSPEGRRPCKQKEPEPVTTAELRVFDLALEDDELVPQEGVLGDELGLAAHGIPGSSCEQRDGGGLEALLYAIADLVGDAEDLGSETTEDIEQGAESARYLAVRTGGYQLQTLESTLQSAQIRTDERSSRHGDNGQPGDATGKAWPSTGR